MVEDNIISMGHARALLGMDDSESQCKLAHNIVEHGLSVRETERAVKRLIESVNATTIISNEAKHSDANLRVAEDKLRRRLGTQVRVLPNSKGSGGKIELQYYNDDDLNRLYEVLISTQNTHSL